MIIEMSATKGGLTRESEISRTGGGVKHAERRYPRNAWPCKYHGRYSHIIISWLNSC